MKNKEFKVGEEVYLLEDIKEYLVGFKKQLYKWQIRRKIKTWEASRWYQGEIPAKSNRYGLCEDGFGTLEPNEHCEREIIVFNDVDTESPMIPIEGLEDFMTKTKTEIMGKVVIHNKKNT